MTASSIFFNGRSTSIPGSYTEIDATGLEAAGLGANGIVALIGTAEGGVPITAISSPSELFRVRRPDQARAVFRGGNLREATDMAFAPSSDPQIPGGAQEVVFVKVNPATQGTLELDNAGATVAIDVTSRDYGAFVNDYTVTLATETPAATRRVTIVAEGITEVFTEITSTNEDLVAAINQSQFVTATLGAGASSGVAADLTATQLTGGTEGTPVAANWQAALDILRQIRVNTVVPLTADPAVHVATEAHCAFMSGAGRSERDCILGIQNTGLTGPATLTEIKAATSNLGSRHARVFTQNVTRFDTAGVRTVFPPYFGAVLLAGMQAGSAPGTSLTFKSINVLDFSQDSSWNPVDNAEDLIQSGAVILERVQGVGNRIVRNVTTFQGSNNIAFTEASVNEAVNFAAFNFRTNLEFAVGRPGFQNTINAVKGIALNTLGLLVDAGVIVSFRNLTFTLNADVLEVSVELAPVIPINFVKSTIFLNAAQLTA